tara:strand:- start:1826 stop:2554 length:729 start_codon:yes stop_codon:yes gene_type:complete
MLFDIIIPVGPKDYDIIRQQIQFTKKNVIGYRNIYLICSDSTTNIEDCITINENIFPFQVEDFPKINKIIENQVGWYLQQLLKLYAGIIIPNILEKYLVIDTDTFFLKPTNFIENGKCLYNYGIENHRHYFEHMKRLDQSLIKKDKNKSGICHHMIFETKYVKEMMNKIENIHNKNFYYIFLEKVNVPKSGASEYEIYFNYMLLNNFDKIKLRELNWINTSKLDFNNNYDYISYHWYKRKNK